jgi:hypothetical protein
MLGIQVLAALSLLSILVTLLMGCTELFSCATTRVEGMVGDTDGMETRETRCGERW